MLWILSLLLTIVVAVAFEEWAQLPSVATLFKPNPIADTKDSQAAPAEQPDPIVRSGELAYGESFYDLMIANGVTDAGVLMMANTSRKVFDLRKVKAGRPYQITFNQTGRPSRFEYEIDDNRMLTLTEEEDGWSARIAPIQYQIKEQVVYGVIKDSVYISLMEICETPTLAMNLADIFAWDIDFVLDIREGDRFGILYQQWWRDDQYVGPGRILAARFINRGETYDAIYFEDPKGYVDYYDAEGRSLQKQFLKSPLRFKYISSYYSRSRLHPILKVRRPHLGIDYAAPYGTRVHAAADGRVVFVGREGGMGKMIKIRHNRSYTTAYGHLSRYAKGLKTGKMVKQDEVIGYVGSTGLSTGPHLHYSFYRNGKLVNPMRIKNPRARPVPSADLPRFKALAQKFLDRLDPPGYEELTAGRL